jgi:uncharacterized damage-inducible protein DinB
MTMRRLIAVLSCLPVIAAVSACQQPAPPPPAPAPPPSTAVTASVKVVSDMVRGYITKSLDEVPDAKLSYQPTKEVRTFAQLFGHIADSNYFFCAASKGEKAPESAAEKLTTKADLKKALADSFAYCDGAFSAINDQTGGAAVEVEGTKSTKIGALGFNSSHNFEHYGNMVTYFRLNKMVPPSSQPSK